MNTVSEWSSKDKVLYFSTALLAWILLTIIAVVYSLKYSVFALIGYLVIYILLVYLQAKDWCIGCPYRGKFCPGILCMGLANIVSTLFKNRKFEYSKKKEHLVSVLTMIYFAYPILFFYNKIWILVAYLTLLIIHLLLVWKLFCPKCKFNKVCPGGKVSAKICSN